MAFLRKLIPGTPALTLATLLFLGLAAYEGLTWSRYERSNRALADPSRLVVDESTAPELVFAAARSESEHGNRQEALRLYNSIARQGSADFQERVHYNLGNLYLREAAPLWNAVGVLEHARVDTLVELAKESYRAALRLNPDNWDARYNLEYAFRITPPPKERAKSDFQGSKSSVFATMPSLPGGGP